MKQTEIREKLAQKILTSLENNNPPWRSLHNRGFPSNPRTGKKYTGINPLILDVIADEKKFRSGQWATYKQWASLGQKVAKNPGVPDWGTAIVNWHPYYKTTPKENIISLSRFHLLERIIVFNADQTFGINTAKFLVLNETKIIPDFTKAQEVVDATGAEIIHKKSIKKPIYERLPKDHILMPLQERFLNDSQYYAALFHELIHHSEFRLGWIGSMALGELIAEIATGYIESELNLPHDTDFTNHDMWKDEWIKEIKENPNYILEAAAQAAKATAYILSFSQPNREEALQEEGVVVKFPKR